MINKNVLLASAALMTLGMASSVNADEKVKATSESAVVAVVPEKEVKPAAEDAKKESAKPDAEKPAAKETAKTEAEEDAKLDAELAENIAEIEAGVDELDGLLTEMDADIKKSEAKDHAEQMAEWATTLTRLFGAVEDMEFTEEFRADIFVKAYYLDVIDLKKEIERYIAENGPADAQDLVDGLNAYLNEVAPVMDPLNDLVKKFHAGKLTEQQLWAEAKKLFVAAEQSLDEAPKSEEAPKAAEKKTEVAPVETKTDVSPVVEEITPEATPVVVETLPETGSDAKSFVSVIGAALAGLTVWGFGFKKRG